MELSAIPLTHASDPEFDPDDEASYREHEASKQQDGCDMHPLDSTQLRQIGRRRNNPCMSTYQRIRYFLIRLMSCPVPGLKANIPVLGACTLVDLCLMAIVCSVVLSKSVHNFKKAGKVLDYLIAIMILISMRSNLLTILFGISFERVIYVHKLTGVLTMTVAGVHALNGLNKVHDTTLHYTTLHYSIRLQCSH
jgi:hypothetical protein